MNEIEFWDAIGAINLLWPNQPIPEKTSEAWWALGFFRDLQAAEVQAAVVALRATEKFSPGPTEIREWIVQHGTVEMGALWTEVWAELLRERDMPRPWSKAEWSAAVRPFAEYVGVPVLQQLTHAKDDGTPLGVLEAQFRKSWEAWRNREQDRRATDALPAVEAFNAAHDPGRLPSRAGGAASIGQIAAGLRVLKPSRRQNAVGEG